MSFQWGRMFSSFLIFRLRLESNSTSRRRPADQELIDAQNHWHHLQLDRFRSPPPSPAERMREERGERRGTRIHHAMQTNPRLRKLFNSCKPACVLLCHGLIEYTGRAFSHHLMVLSLAPCWTLREEREEENDQICVSSKRG